ERLYEEMLSALRAQRLLGGARGVHFVERVEELRAHEPLCARRAAVLLREEVIGVRVDEDCAVHRLEAHRKPIELRHPKPSLFGIEEIPILNELRDLPGRLEESVA